MDTDKFKRMNVNFLIRVLSVSSRGLIFPNETF